MFKLLPNIPANSMFGIWEYAKLQASCQLENYHVMLFMY